MTRYVTIEEVSVVRSVASVESQLRPTERFREAANLRGQAKRRISLALRNPFPIALLAGEPPQLGQDDGVDRVLTVHALL